MRSGVTSEGTRGRKWSLIFLEGTELPFSFSGGGGRFPTVSGVWSGCALCLMRCCPEGQVPDVLSEAWARRRPVWASVRRWGRGSACPLVENGAGQKTRWAGHSEA